MADPGPYTERIVVENEFGTITNKRVIYYRAKGWFSDGSREDIPLQRVTSVRQDISRSVFLGTLFVLISLALLGAEGDAVVLGVLFFAVAFLLMWGSPTVVVKTSGRTLKAAKGLPWQRQSADDFVEALRQQLFDKAA
jgi:O-antigen ligase